ncbi:hypothetical protein D3C71_23200 [compost metagenome]
MIDDIRFLSAREMRRVKPANDTLVISILDHSEARVRPRLAGFRSVLCLTCEDAFESADAAAWPDEPSDAEHAQLAIGRDERVPALSDAQRIVQFLLPHRHSGENLHLLVHCFAGLSRSAAVAEWAGSWLWKPILNAHQKPDARPNPRLLKLLHQASAGTR